MNRNKNIRNTIATFLCAATLAGCAEPRKEPVREAYQDTFLRTQHGTMILDTCDAQGENGSDGIADSILFGSIEAHGPYPYQFLAPGCHDRRNAIHTLEMTPDLQKEATQMLQSYSAMRYAVDRATWEYEQGQRQK